MSFKYYNIFNLTKREIGKINQKKYFEEAIQLMKWNKADIFMAINCDNEIYFHNGTVLYEDDVNEEILSALKEYNKNKF